MIEAKNIFKSYAHPVLLDFSHTFPEGEISCILGPSGCGKTTLLRIIAGLEQADSGEILGAEGKNISALFQENRLFENLSAEKNVLLTARPGFSRQDAKRLLEDLGLPDTLKPVREFSGGMQRRTAIARALAAQYDILLLDEPLNALDERTRAHTRDFIRQNCRGKTCIWITHFPEDAKIVGAHVLEMK